MEAREGNFHGLSLDCCCPPGGWRGVRWRNEVFPLNEIFPLAKTGWNLTADTIHAHHP
jgi:hypothetical protein